jgi:hypothetical protein
LRRSLSRYGGYGHVGRWLVEKFDHEDDRYAVESDGKLVVHRHDGTVKTYTKGSFSTVDGKPMEIGF